MKAVKKFTALMSAMFALTVLAMVLSGCSKDKGGDDDDDGGNSGGNTGSAYTVTFNAGGGTVNPKTAKTGTDGTLASLPAPTKEGYYFDGWYTAESGGTEVTASTAFSKNTTIYARWSEEPVLPPPTAEAKVFAVDISAETEWNYMLVASDGSSMFIEVDESTDAPSRVFVKPDNNSDSGFTVFFKENGLPDKLVADGHILYSSNFKGNKFDLAVIYPNDSIEYFFDIETDVNWDDYVKALGLSKARSQSAALNNVDDFFLVVQAMLGAYTCASWFVDLSSAAGCALYVLSESIDEKLPDDVKWDDLAFIAIDWGFCVAGKDVVSCVSALVSTAEVLYDAVSDIVSTLFGQKSKQIQAASSGKDKVSTCTVTFNANGGTVTPKSITMLSGVKLSSLPTPTRYGFNFVGWFTAVKGGTEVTASKVYSINTTVYARWTAQYGSVSYSGQAYKTIKIGTQTWMAENLNYNIPGVDSDVCYKNSADSCAKYGRLYEWYTALSACPVGWHIPDTTEWNTLEDFVGGRKTAGEQLKSVDWGGTDNYGFTALPGGRGLVMLNTENFEGAGNVLLGGGAWWTATENDTISNIVADVGFGWSISALEDNVSTGAASSGWRASIRCVQDVPAPYTITFTDKSGAVKPTSVKTGANGKLSSLPTPTREGFIFDGWYTTSAAGTKVDVSRAYTTNATLYARWITESATPGSYGSVTYGGKTYKTVKILTQTWFAENLNYDIPNDTTDKCYADSPDSCAKYGRLYNWNAAIYACPAGWHLPSNSEWKALESYAGADAGGLIPPAAAKLKSKTGWYNNGNGTDDYGFAALPGGVGQGGVGGAFTGAGSSGYWWDAEAYTVLMSYNGDTMARMNNGKTVLLSVRCVAD